MQRKMYQHIPVVEYALAAAESSGETVMRDRRSFIPFLRAAETYAHDHGLILGGTVATLLLQKEKLGSSEFFYELYSVNAQADAQALADLIYAVAPEGLARYTVAMSRAAAQPEFEILVDERPLILVKTLIIHRGARIIDVLTPSVRPAYFARDAKNAPLPLLCMGPEVQLIAIYSALSDPSRAGEWATLVAAEEKLRMIFEREIRGKMSTALSEAVGGGGPNDSATLIAALVREYVPLEGHALVGIQALTKKRVSPGRIQLVSANPFHDEEAAVRKIANRLGFSVSSARHEPQVPTDCKLRRLTMYIVHSGGRREAFLDVYNSGTYQLVACQSVKSKNDKTMLGTAFTVLRFILVDIWTIQLLFRMGAVPIQYARQLLSELVAGYTSAAAAYLAARDADRFDVIFSAEYIGQFRDPTICAKRDRFRSGGSSGGGYYPAKKPREAGVTPQTLEA